MTFPQGTLLAEVRAVTRRQASAVTCMCTDADCNFVISGDASKEKSDMWSETWRWYNIEISFTGFGLSYNSSMAFLPRTSCSPVVNHHLLSSECQRLNSTSLFLAVEQAYFDGIVSECREVMLQSRMMKVVEGWGQSKIVPWERR